jgi:hypothetical protein
MRRNELAKAAPHSEIVGASARAREMSVAIRSDSIRVAVETTSCTRRVYQKGPWQAKAWQVVHEKKFFLLTRSVEVTYLIGRFGVKKTENVTVKVTNFVGHESCGQILTWS